MEYQRGVTARCERPDPGCPCCAGAAASGGRHTTQLPTGEGVLVTRPVDGCVGVCCVRM